ncbi:G-type lectin S-receptor-like serine/threonine-protein kinase [Gossypium australe]|uniref:non-specific serine/threonine protein kinase n=1 Tax=Gossypium australe TaxID=47621 RepID=A0A5B6VEV9_9ROSI|nr:G-type lectin S-receptor-like serine/threonine-protein kinase [Gossypium australe]
MFKHETIFLTDYPLILSDQIRSKGKLNEKLKAVIIAISVIIASGMTILALLLYVQKIMLRNTGEHGKEDLELPVFDFATIATATNNFSSNNILGQGGFGPVYKGTLIEGQDIAVKRLSKNSGQGLEEFKNEVTLISKLQHRNLVKLFGCCIRKDEKMLVYEYMPNKSLNYFIFGSKPTISALLFLPFLPHPLVLCYPFSFYFFFLMSFLLVADQTRSKLLDWRIRMHVVDGIARGVLYLHHDSRLKIIHRDLKASNILLDHNMNPKISDFGLARKFGVDQTQAKTKRVVGTYGYMSPEYALDGLFSMKSDVFSFGVLVLEILSGKKNRGFSHPEHDHNLLGHAWKLWMEKRPLELIDPALGDSYDATEGLRCINVALLCVQQCPPDRPNMSLVLVMLCGDSVLPKPKQPGFFIERNLPMADSISVKNETSSMYRSITSLEPR